MSKISINRLTNANVYLDGGSMLGRAEEVSLPVLKAKMAEHKALGMVVAIVGFAGAASLGPGQVVAFAVICVASGLALGADLALPAALLAHVIRRQGHGDADEGAYFGWWNAGAKLNLALAAGLALPLLQVLGYTPGSTDPQGSWWLAMTYGVLPCGLKVLALAAVWRWQDDWITTKESMT